MNSTLLIANIFETIANALDAAGNKEGLHDAITHLAKWIESTEGKLSESELLASIPASAGHRRSPVFPFTLPR